MKPCLLSGLFLILFFFSSCENDPEVSGNTQDDPTLLVIIQDAMANYSVPGIILYVETPEFTSAQVKLLRLLLPH